LDAAVCPSICFGASRIKDVHWLRRSFECRKCFAFEESAHSDGNTRADFKELLLKVPKDPAEI